MKSIFIILSLFLSSIIYSQESESPKKASPIPEAQIFTTGQSMEIDGNTINLEAITGTMLLRDDESKPIALFGFTSYTKGDSNSERPLLFAYNGGPGSASVPLHIGILGPKRIVVNDPYVTPAAPYEMVNNEYSILDVADLVMIDPVGSGLSVPVGEASYDDFWGVDQDIRSISLFIKQYLIENGRMNSPKFLLGESYGTFRNAGVMNYLLDNGIALNGVIMVSAVFDLRTLLFPPNDDLPYVLHIPSYAAAAWYHDVLETKPENLETFLEEVKSFTENEYSPALYKGDKISDEEINKLATNLEKYTGIDNDVWKRANLRLNSSEFLQELLRDEGQTVDRLDSRYTGPTLDKLSQHATSQPFLSYSIPPFTAGFLNYFHEELKADRNLDYHQSARHGNSDFKWDWKHEGNVFWGAPAAINVSDDMAQAMTKDPNVKVLIMSGYYDNGTPYYAVEHTIDHLGLTKEIKNNISMEYYEAGHMMYLHQGSIAKFKTDLSEFIQSGIK